MIYTNNQTNFRILNCKKIESLYFQYSKVKWVFSFANFISKGTLSDQPSSNIADYFDEHYVPMLIHSIRVVPTSCRR